MRKLSEKQKAGLRAASKRYYQNHKAQVLAARKQYFCDHKNEIKIRRAEYNKAYRASHKNERKAYDKKLWLKKHASISDRSKKWRQSNPEKYQASRKSYAITHADEIRIYRREWHRRARKENIEYRLCQNFRSRIRLALKSTGVRKSVKTIELTGCDIDTLRKHIESNWKPGMSWGNYGPSGWHIDHIRPCASFDLTDIDQQKQCFHWSNLQPLWAKDNILKRDKWQPS